MNQEKFRAMMLAEIDRLAEIHGPRKVYPKICRMKPEDARLLMDDLGESVPCKRLSFEAHFGVPPSGARLNIDGVWIVPDESVSEPTWESEAGNATP